MPRVRRVPQSELPEELAHIVESQLFERYPDALTDEYRQLRREDTTLSSYRVLAHQPAALAAFRDYQGSLWNDTGIDPRFRELVILTVARELGSRYQWHSHVRVALVEGVPPETLVAISGRDLETLDDREAAVMQYVEDFVANSVDQAAHETLSERFDDRFVVGINMLAGFYLMLGLILASLDVELEEPFVGWELEAL